MSEENKQYKEWLLKYSPAFYFHKGEDSFPIAFKKLLKFSKLKAKVGNKGKSKTLLDNDEITENILHQIALVQQKKMKIDEINDNKISNKKINELKDFLTENTQKKIKFTIEPDHNQLNRELKGIQNKPIVHGEVAKVVFKENNQEQTYFRFTYVFVYAQNDPPFAFKAGYHLSDIEHVSVYVKANQNGEPENEIDRMYYAQHGSLEGEWVRNKKIQFDEQNGVKHPIVYIAKGSHASYKDLGFPSPFSLFNKDRRRGFIPRAFGFASDEVGKGDQVNAQSLNQVNQIKKMPSAILEKNNFFGGKYNIQISKGFSRGFEHPFSTNFWIRLLPVWFMKPFMRRDHKTVKHKTANGETVEAEILYPSPKKQTIKLAK